MEPTDSDRISPAFLAVAVALVAAVGASGFMLWRVNAPVLEPSPWE